jgi:hypothetical protein
LRTDPAAQAITMATVSTLCRTTVGLGNARGKGNGTDSVSTVRFTLNYDGPLPSRGNASHKKQIREALDPQLRELWTHEPLTNYPEYLRVPEANKISVLLTRGRSRLCTPRLQATSSTR